MNTSTVNIFFFDTELQFLASKSICRFYENETIILFTFKKALFEKIVQFYPETHCILLNKDSHGFFDRLRVSKLFLRRIQKEIGLHNPSPGKIVIHTPRIDQYYQNLPINFLIDNFPKSHITCRLLPDGILNVTTSSCTTAKNTPLSKKLRNLKYQLFIGTRYYNFKGCNLGIEDPIFDMLYFWNGISVNFTSKKQQSIQFAFTKKFEKTSTKALVIGERLIESGNANIEKSSCISKKIFDYISQNNITDIDYIQHPRSSYCELSSKNYNMLNIDYFCAESLIAESNYSHIIGCCSSVLVTAKIITDTNSEIVSIGLSDIYEKESFEYAKIHSLFIEHGVSVL